MDDGRTGLAERLDDVPRPDQGREGRGARRKRSERGRIVAANDVDAAVRPTFRRDGESELLLRDTWHRKRCRRHRDKSNYVDCAIVIAVFNRWAIRFGVVRMAVSLPMSVDGRAVVMGRRMLVRVAVDEESPDGCHLERQGQRKDYGRSHDASLLDAANQKVKATCAGHMVTQGLRGVFVAVDGQTAGLLGVIDAGL
jgi:hypothetical protein